MRNIAAMAMMFSTVSVGTRPLNWSFKAPRNGLIVRTTHMEIAIGNPRSASVVPCRWFIHRGRKRPTTPKLNAVFATSYNAHDMVDLFMHSESVRLSGIYLYQWPIH